MKSSTAVSRSWLQGHLVKSTLGIARVASLLLLAVLAAGQLAQAQTLLLQLQAANYNPNTGLWTATVGANAQASGTYPTLTNSVSPNGSPAVVFNGANQLALASSIPAANGYTAFAYIKPATGAGPYALFGGASVAFELRIYNSKQDALRQQTTDLGSETTALSTSAFSLIDCTVTNVGGGGFRLNGVADGTTAAGSFTAAISAIGARATSGGENFSGSICEIDIYSGVLTPAQITNVEAALTAAYVTALPPSAPVMSVATTANPSVASVGGNDTLYASFTGTSPISYQWQVATNASGGGATSLTGQTNTTLVLTNLQLTNSSNYYSLQATNTVSPYVSNSTWLALNVQPLTALVQLIASNYDGSSVWTDTSGNGNNATYSGGTAPTLATFVTPNGGSAVNITSGGGSFALASSLSASSGYTVFAYVEPSSIIGRHALVGGSASVALEYDIYNTNQDYLTEYTTDVGHGTAAIPTNSFSLIDLAVNSSGGAFRFNGASDASVAGATFTQPITRIGNNHGFGDGYVGNIAEIDIYNGVLTAIQISNVEAQLTAKYVTANTIIIGPATVSPTNNTFAGNSITLSAPVIGGTGTTTYKWQTDNGSGGTSYSNIGGATTTNYVLNTTGLNGTYMYQLIGTPFGGNSVTSAPVTLTVNAASAPQLLVDTAANPNPATVGGNETFSAAFVGNLPISYQWQVSANSSGIPATNLTGQTNTTLVLTNLQLANSGNYYSLQASNAISPNLNNSSWLQLSVQPLTALVQLIATNYSPSGATWTDSSGNGNNAYYAGSSTPTLVPFVTPNGSSAVNITSGSGSFLLSSPLAQSGGYTVFAYLMPTNKSGAQAITGGSSSGALEYSVKNDKQHYAVEYVADIGDGTTNVSTNAFSLIDLAVSSSGGAFRYNGSSDGSVAGSTFTSAITRIGNNEGGGDGLVGEVAEIDIYSGVLTYIQITNIEAQLTAEYVTASTIVIGAATVSPTNNTFAGNSVTLSAPIIGGTGTTVYQWQTDNGTGGSSFSNIGGATTTNYLLNTTGLAANSYEYQLIGTPFGGTSVTSAPVTLNVQSPSAPVVLVDTAANPSSATVGGNETFTAAFVGNLPISYQWQVSTNSSGIPATSLTGQTNTTLVLTNLQLANSGNYYSLQASNAISPNLANSSWLPLNVQSLTPSVQLIATNYDGSSVWTDSSGNGNNATYTGVTAPTLVPSVTPNGSSVVDIASGSGYFLLSSSLAQSNGYTVFAYVMPSTVLGGARYALTGGVGYGPLEYDFYKGSQDYLIQYTSDVGSGIATNISTSSFSLVDLAVNSSGASFRLNGSSDGSVAGATFTQPITCIGNNQGNGDGFVGDIAEIDIYSGVLNYIQITNIEAQLTAKYGAAGIPPVVTGLKFTSSPVISGTSLTISATNSGAGGIYLLTSTNVALPLSSWKPVWTNVVGGSGSFTTNLAGVVNAALGQQFYILSNTNY
jgi:hypothetical protein